VTLPSFAKAFSPPPLGSTSVAPHPLWPLFFPLLAPMFHAGVLFSLSNRDCLLLTEFSGFPGFPPLSCACFQRSASLIFRAVFLACEGFFGNLPFPPYEISNVSRVLFLRFPFLTCASPRFFLEARALSVVLRISSHSFFPLNGFPSSSPKPVYPPFSFFQPPPSPLVGEFQRVDQVTARTKLSPSPRIRSIPLSSIFCGTAHLCSPLVRVDSTAVSLD